MQTRRLTQIRIIISEPGRRPQAQLPGSAVCLSVCWTRLSLAGSGEPRAACETQGICNRQPRQDERIQEPKIQLYTAGCSLAAGWQRFSADKAPIRVASRCRRAPVIGKPPAAALLPGQLSSAHTPRTTEPWAAIASRSCIFPVCRRKAERLVLLSTIGSRAHPCPLSPRSSPDPCPLPSPDSPVLSPGYPAVFPGQWR